MVWFKVDDGAAFHHKVIAAGNSAMGLWVRAGSWSAQQLTDGFVPDHMVTVLGTAAQAQRLVRAGLWEVADGGYYFHDWTECDRNPTRHEITLKRKRASERQNRKRSKNPPDSEEPQVTDGCHSVTDPDVTGGVTGGVTGPPSRPDHVSPNGDTSGGARTRARATRLPDEFAITDGMRAWAAEKVPGVDPDYETEKFCDYWRGVSGQRGTKRDWVGAWRNWLRKASENVNRRRPQSGQAPSLSTADQRVLEAQRLKHNPPSDGGFGQLRVIEA